MQLLTVRQLEREAPARRRRAAARALPALLTAAALALTGCSSAAAPSSDAHHPDGTVVRVPQDFPSVQKAVDVAREGDTVLVSPGTYRESVRITKPRIVLRGTDRNTVVLDGGVRLVNVVF